MAHYTIHLNSAYISYLLFRTKHIHPSAGHNGIIIKNRTIMIRRVFRSIPTYMYLHVLTNLCAPVSVHLGFVFLSISIINSISASQSLSLHEKNYVPRIFIYYVHICTCGRGSVTGSDKRVDTFGLLDVNVSCCMVVGGSVCV